MSGNIPATMPPGSGALFGCLPGRPYSPASRSCVHYSDCRPRSDIGHYPNSTRTTARLLSRLVCRAKLVEHLFEDASDFRGLAALDVATMQHVDRLSILE
jgi:hypothetical protein